MNKYVNKYGVSKRTIQRDFALLEEQFPELMRSTEIFSNLRDKS